MDDNATGAAGRSARAGERRLRLLALGVSLVIHAIAFIILVLGSEAPEFSELPFTTLWVLEPPEDPIVFDVPDISAPELPQIGDIPQAQPVHGADLGDAIVPPAIDLPYSADTRPGIPGTVAPLRDMDPLRGRLEYRRVPGGSGDIWRPLEVVELSADDLARARVATRLDAFNDSMAAEAVARARGTDWTVRTAEGGRWGVTPDSIYVGDKAVRNFMRFSPPPGRREEIAGRLRTYGEIQYQVNRAEGNDIINDRIKAIRARMDAERARRNAITSGG